MPLHNIVQKMKLLVDKQPIHHPVDHRDNLDKADNLLLEVLRQYQSDLRIKQSSIHFQLEQIMNDYREIERHQP